MLLDKTLLLIRDVIARSVSDEAIRFLFCKKEVGDPALYGEQLVLSEAEGSRTIGGTATSFQLIYLIPYAYASSILPLSTEEGVS